MTPLRFALFFLILGGVLLAANRHVFRWVDDAFHPPPWVKKALAWALGLSLFMTFAGRMVEHLLWPDAPIAGLLATSSGFQLSALMGSILLLALDLVLLVISIGSWGPKLLNYLKKVNGAAVAAEESKAAHEPLALTGVGASAVGADDPSSARVTHLPARTPHPTRRKFLVQASAGSALLVSSSSSLYGSLSGRHDYQLQEVALRIPGLSPRFDGFTIAQISDIHVGQFVGSPELAAAEELIARAKPDLIVMTGDLVDHDARRSAELGRFVRRLVPLARHGVAAVTGNHDFYAGADQVVAAVRAGGGRVLRNSAEILGQPGAGIALLGVDDLFGRREGTGPNLQAAIAGLTAGEARTAPALDLPRVLLCHQPVFFEDSAAHVALQLSGHTHGGQVNLLVRPADWVLPHGWVAGAYEHQGATLYVNRGFGTAGPPARIGAAPEITRLVLMS